MFVFFISLISETVLYSSDGKSLISASGYTTFTVESNIETIQGSSATDYAFKGSSNTLTKVILLYMKFGSYHPPPIF